MMARQKTLKPLRSYLRRQVSAVSQNADVIEMFKGLAAKGSGVSIKRVARPLQYANLDE